jgi:hypothetical protein
MDTVPVIGASAFRDTVKIFERMDSRVPTGTQPTFALVDTWKACVIELNARARKAYGSLESEVTHEIKMRGTPEFRMGRTEFEVGALRLKPLAPPRVPGHHRRPITLIPCKDVTQNRPPEGSGS